MGMPFWVGHIHAGQFHDLKFGMDTIDHHHLFEGASFVTGAMIHLAMIHRFRFGLVRCCLSS